MAAVLQLLGCGDGGAEPPVTTEIIRESRLRDDIPDSRSPGGLRVVQITTDRSMFSHHLYPEAQMSVPGTDWFVFHRMPAEGSDTGDYWLCDPADDFSLRRLTDEKGIRRVAVTPDGRWMYYFIETSGPDGTVLTLKRLSFKDFSRRTLLRLDGPIPGTDSRASRISGPSISSDGARLATYAFLGDGVTDNAPYGLLVFDLEKLTVKLIFTGVEFCNMHVQYCRSDVPDLSHDIMIQHNHESVHDQRGNVTTLQGGKGTDLHVIRDDGSTWRDVPLGRDGVFFSTGHEQWRGRTGTVFSSLVENRTGINHLYLAQPILTDSNTSHRGFGIPGARYLNLTRDITDARFNHFSGDATGDHLVLRNERAGADGEIELFLGTVTPGDEPELAVSYLLSPRSKTEREGWERGQSNKPRPFFSPDGRVVYFHSDLDGPSQIFMVEGYKFPSAK
ncbi:hypothetical protein ACFLT7_08155 [candidate division KSB1 bacterium]